MRQQIKKCSVLSFLPIHLILIQLLYGSTHEIISHSQTSLNKTLAQAKLTVSPMESAENLWKNLFKDILPRGVVIHSIKYNGENLAAGVYKNFPSLDGVIYPDDGILLTSGKADSVLGPNIYGSTTTMWKDDGDDELLNLAKDYVNPEVKHHLESYDAANLVIEFSTDTSIKNFSFDFVYGSEEYPEFVNTDYNDIFCALLDGVNVSYDGNRRLICVNNDFFRCSNLNNRYHLRYDGFTPLLRTVAILTPGRHTLKLAICDIGDRALDSGVFLSRFKFNASGTGTFEVSLIQDQTFYVFENAPAHTFIGQIQTLSDQSQKTFSLLDTQKEFFLDPSSGKLTLSPDASLSAVQKNKYTFRTVVTVNNTLKDTALITVHVLSASNNNLIDDHEFTMREDAAPGSIVGVISALLPVQLSFKVLDVQNEFVLNESNGTITLAPNAVLSAVQKNRYTFKVFAALQDKIKDTALITITVLPADKINLIDNQSFTIKEDMDAGKAVGVIKGVVSQPLNFTIVDTQNEFILDESSGTIRLSATAALDALHKNNYTFRVIAKAGIQSDTALITVTILPRDAVNLVDDQVFYVREDAPANTLIGKITTHTAQVSASFKVIDIQKEFVVQDNDGSISLSSAAELGHSQKETYKFRIQVTSGRDSDTALITIHVIEVDKSIPATAAVYDQNGNGFIDKISISLPDSVILIAQLPSITELIGDITMKLECYLGSVTLHTDQVVRIDNHSFEITVKENNGPVFETGWKQAAIALKPVTITTTKKYTVLSNVIDRAGPVISRVVLSENESGFESLQIQFSEPLDWHQSGISAPRDVYNYSTSRVRERNWHLPKLTHRQ